MLSNYTKDYTTDRQTDFALMFAIIFSGVTGERRFLKGPST